MQVADHKSGTGRGGSGSGIWKDPEGYLLKDNFSEKEKTFYDNLETTNDSILKELREFVPRYRGVTIVQEVDGNEEIKCLVCMEDLTRDFTLPSTIKIKLGEPTWEPGERKEKIEERKTKCALMWEHYGFCIPGALYYDVVSEKFEKCERPAYGMKPKQAIEFLYKFINGQSGLKFDLVNRILEELRKIYSWFERQRHYKFNQSSILIVYDAASLKENQATVRVRMVDFSHVTENREKDVNYMRGLRNLIGLLENFEVAVWKYSNISRDTGISYRNPIMGDKEQEKSSHVSLPAGFTPFDQITGRVINKGGKKLGFLKDAQGNLLKPDPHREEINFYNTLSTTDDPVLIELKQYIPTYFGMKTIEIENEVIRFLQIENIMKDFELPCRMDVKVGVKRRPHWAPPKVAKKLPKYKAMFTKWKFAIPGYEYYRVPVEADIIPERNSRKYTQHMQPHEGVATLYNFVNGKWGIGCGLVDSLLRELQKMESWIQRQRHYRFYHGSILLTYDAKCLDDFSKGLLTANHCRNSKIPVRVCMIDFGNTFPDTIDEPDENYLEGLRNLIFILNGLSTFDADDISRKKC